MPAIRTFDVPGLVTLPAFDATDGTGPEGVASVRRSTRLTLRTTYVDTADLRLARSGVVVRHTSGGGAAHWHLDIAGEEVSVPGALGAVPAEVADLLAVWLRGAAIGPVAGLRTERQVTELRGPLGEDLAELTDDEVSVLEGRRIALKHRELTLRRSRRPDITAYDGDQPVPDPKQIAAHVAQLLTAAGAVEGEHVPALSRALGARATGDPEVPAPGRPGPDDPAGDVVLLALRSGTRKLFDADTAVRLDRADGVHQLRVACRRLRSDLTTFADLVDAERVAPLVAGTRWLASELGPARDTEVLRERLAASARADTLLPLDPAALLRLDAQLADVAAAAEARALACLRDPRYADLVDALVAACHDPGFTAAAAKSAAEVLPGLVGAAWHRLEKRAAKLELRDPDADWHDARKAAKRARYAGEAVAPALGRRAAAVGKAAATLQEVLGEHQDAAVAADALVLLASEAGGAGGAGGDPAYAFTLGRLAERQRAEVVAARRAFPAVWRGVSLAKVARWTRTS